jgi:hypothetical protein
MPVLAPSPNLSGSRRLRSRRAAGGRECASAERRGSRRHPACDPHALEVVYDDYAQRGLEHEDAVAATAVQLLVSVHQVQHALAARGPAPTLAASRLQ